MLVVLATFNCMPVLSTRLSAAALESKGAAPVMCNMPPVQLRRVGLQLVLSEPVVSEPAERFMAVPVVFQMRVSPEICTSPPLMLTTPAPPAAEERPPTYIDENASADPPALTL